MKNNLFLTVLFLTVTLFCSLILQAQQKLSFQKVTISGKGPNTSKASPYFPLSVSDRQKIDELIAKMTVEEKAGQLASFYPNGNVRLNIPHMQAGECLHGVVANGATSFPAAIALGSTWDPALAESVATAIAMEARALGIQHCYTPMLGVVRDARWGRFEEAYGEDAYLVSRMGVGFINGLQGKGKNRFDKDHVLATAKHFVADGEPVLGANGAPVEISLRSLHEIHLPPFRAAVEEAHVGAIMPAHHSLNGIPCHVNTYTLDTILRKGYGFDGLIVSDNNDIRWVQDRFHLTDSRDKLMNMSLGAGVHTELAFKEAWTGRRIYGAALVAAVKKGAVPLKLLDNAVRKVLEVKFMMHLQNDETTAPTEVVLEKKGGKTADESDVFFTDISGSFAHPRKDYLATLNDPAQDQLALEAARKAIILLKNEKGTLPLKKDKLIIAVIGPNADTIRLGTYSTQKPKHFITVRQGLEKLKGEDSRIVYEKGCEIQSTSDARIPAAVELASHSDVCVVVLGDDERTIMENVDRDDINLPGGQEELLKAVVATGKPVILVLLHGRPVAIQWAKDHVSAILDGWFLGQETGTAVAEAIFGLINPGGKLTVTYPRNVGQVPAFYNSLPNGRPRTLWNASSEPTYPFGYGLSYTTFSYSGVSLSAPAMRPGDTVYAMVNLTNTGRTKGDEIVQLYIHQEVSSLVRPVKELKGFRRITLEPGETKNVRFPIDARSLEFWKEGNWITERGIFTIMIGPSSESLTNTKLELK
ncbi:glycoside hydrolase family 3 N-terminal domain-containing protein [Flavitalea flava]